MNFLKQFLKTTFTPTHPGLNFCQTLMGLQKFNFGLAIRYKTKSPIGPSNLASYVQKSSPPDLFSQATSVPSGTFKALG
jgi:hypothetical protein